MNLDRRRFLQLGASGAAIGAFGSAFRWPFLTRTLQAAQFQGTAKKLLVIFMRGGNDGINTVIPQGDNEYNVANRPTLLIPEGASLDLNNGFARLHPALQRLHEVYLQGDVAVIHRCAYEDQSRSHFDSQQFWENAQPGSSEEEGWLYRHVNETYDIEQNPLAAVSISDQLMVMFKGENALPHIPSVASYTLGGTDAASAEKVLGDLPGKSDTGSGLLGWYGQPANGVGYDVLVKTTGLILGSSLQALEDAGVDPATYVPENGATYPNADNPEGFPGNSFQFFERLRDAAMLLKLTDMRVVGLEIGGFDTHSAQGAINGQQSNLLSQIAHGVRSISRDLQSIWDDTLVLTCSEFGRTSEENGSFGTDHGEGSCLFVAGGGVNGGVYNCDSVTWPDGTMFSTPNGRYVAHLTDYRAIFGEILSRHFGLDAPTLDIVLPGYSGHVGDPKFDLLGFLPK